MNVSVRWLKALAPGLVGTGQELADRLAMLAVPVDEIVDVGSALGDIVVVKELDKSSPKLMLSGTLTVSDGSFRSAGGAGRSASDRP